MVFDERLTTKEAAIYLGVAVNTLARMRSQNRGPSYIRVGRSIYYTMDQLNNYLRGTEVSPEEEKWKSL